MPETTTTVPVDYGQQYLAIIEPTNCELDKVTAMQTRLVGDDFTDEDWPTIRSQFTEAYASFSASLVNALESLVTSTWPTDVQTDIDQLSCELSQLAAATARLSRAATAQDVVDGYTEPYEVPNNAAATTRAKLGLDSNIGREAGSSC